LAIDRISPPIYGEAVFGTGNGLTIDGNGILASRAQTSGVFEFDIGRGSRKPLHRLSRGRTVAFRRRVSLGRDGQYEMLGLISPCRDLHNRAGFYGGCVITDCDRVRRERRVHDWIDAIGRAGTLHDEAEAHLDPKTGQLNLPRGGLVRPASSDQDVELHLASARELLLSCEDTGLTADHALEHMQAVAFLQGEQIPTIFLLEESLPETVSLLDPAYSGAPERFEQLYGGASPHQSRGAEVTEETLEAAASYGLPSGGARRRQEIGAERPGWGPEMSLEERVYRLERQMEQLISPVPAPATGSAASGRSWAPGRVFSGRRQAWWGDGAGRTVWIVAGAVVTGLAIVAVVFLLFRAGGTMEAVRSLPAGVEEPSGRDAGPAEAEARGAEEVDDTAMPEPEGAGGSPSLYRESD